MKRYYRNRIMLSAMLSFLIILVIAVAGIWFSVTSRLSGTRTTLSPPGWNPGRRQMAAEGFPGIHRLPCSVIPRAG